MEALSAKTTKHILEKIPVSKGERLELQKELYNYIIEKWNKGDKDFIPLNRAEISQAIGCKLNRVSSIVGSLIHKGLIEIDRIKKHNVDIYSVFKIRTDKNYDLSQEQQDILIYLKNRKGAYNADELTHKVAMEYFPMVKELKGLKEKGLIDMWHSKSRDGYAYNVKGNLKGESETLLIDFFYSQQDRIKIRKEKIKRFNKMRYNQSILKRINQTKEKEKDLANYGACVAIGERRRLGDISANAIKNYNILCNECGDEVLLEAFKKSFIQSITEAKREIDNGKLYHTQKFKFPFHGALDRLVAISLAKSYSYNFTTNEIEEVVIIDKINCNLISKSNKFKQGVSNEK
ncbi:hypothetical protein HpBT060_15110 [Helicobacter pylori]